MRRVAASLIALAAVALPLRAQTIPVALGGQRTSLVGLPFGVPITVDMSARTDKLGAFALRITWNPAVLQFKSGANGTFGGVTVNQDSAASGVLRLSGANPAGVSGLVTLGTGTFVPLTADTATFALQLTELYAAGTFTDLLPSAQVAAAAVYCPARGRFGDVNGDGNVNSADALIALSSVVGLPTGSYDVSLGDVDANGATTARDALIMLSSAVGLDVSAYRVYQVAGGSCAAFATTTMAVVPGSFTMLVGQQATLEVRRADSTGALVTLTDLVWKSSRPGVVGVLADGTAIARDTGTATIVALHGTTDSALALIHVDSSRTVQVVDAQAVAAPVQLGSAAWPFGTVAQAMLIARPGDTVEIRPGTYQESVTLDRDVRLLGDTAADGSRPVIVNPYGDGVLLTGSGYREVHNLAFGPVMDAVNVNGPSSVTLTGLVGQNLPTGIVVTSGTPTVRLAGSRLSGSGSTVCCSSYAIEASSGPLDSLLIDGSDLSDFYNSGIYMPYGGAVVIRRSRLHDFGSYGLELGGNSGPGVRLLVDSSILARSSYELISLADVVSASIAHSALISAPYQDVIYQYQENIPAGGFVALHADSVVSTSASWLYANDLDSVLVDSVRALIPFSSGTFYSVGYVRVTRSAFVDASGEAIYFNNYGSGGVLDVRNTSFTGDPAQDLSGSPVYVTNVRTTIDSTSFQNASNAVQVTGDSSLVLTNSSFRHVAYPVYYDGNWYAGCTGVGCQAPDVGATVRHSSFTGYYKAVDVEYGAMAVDTNDFTGNDHAGIYGFQNTQASVTFNTMAGDGTPIEVDLVDTSATARITDNTLSGVTLAGIYGNATSAPDSVHARYEILRNQVNCVASNSPTGIQAYDADALIAANQVTDCSYGIYVYSPTTTSRADSVAGNTVQLPLGGNNYGGIVALYNLRSRLVGNTVTADTTGGANYGPIYAAAVSSTYYGGTAAYVDSNTVTGGVYYGLSVFDVDTALVAGNTLLGVRNYAGSGAIILDGTISTHGAVVGNVVRHATGTGIQVNNLVADTIVVDSNMVSHAGAQAVLHQGGNAQITRNTLDSNATGIEIYAYLTPLITQNNIFGNAFGLANDGPSVVTAQNNWWGSAAGPSCQDTTCTAGAGDSVTTGTVSWQPALAAPNGAAPPPSAPRVFAAARPAPRLAALRALPASDAMPPALTARRSTAVAPAARATAAVRPLAPGATPALARQLQLQAERRSAALERMAQRAEQDAAQRAERAARHAAQTQPAARTAPPVHPPFGPGARP